MTEESQEQITKMKDTKHCKGKQVIVLLFMLRIMRNSNE